MPDAKVENVRTWRADNEELNRLCSEPAEDEKIQNGARMHTGHSLDAKEEEI